MNKCDWCDGEGIEIDSSYDRFWRLTIIRMLCCEPGCGHEWTQTEADRNAYKAKKEV